MTQQPTQEQPVVELTIEECWDLLAAAEVGRLAYRLVDEIHIVPINYGVHDRRLLVRTAPGNKLLSSELGSEVALQIDWYGEHDAWSVLARGRLRHLEEAEEHLLTEHVRPWVPTLKYEGVELTPDVITGRRFYLDSEE